MALKYHPKPGTVVICDYQTGFKPPEMVKVRLAVVMSPRLPNRDDLCTVVPLSRTVPVKQYDHHCRIELPVDPPPPYEGRIKWAKADMLATLCLKRLSLPYTERDRGSGKRRYLEIVMEKDEMEKVQMAILHALGLDGLTKAADQTISDSVCATE